MSEVRGCTEKVRLLYKFQDATTLYSQLVRDLARTAESQYEFVSRTTIEARMASQAARERFYKHVEEHGC